MVDNRSLLEVWCLDPAGDRERLGAAKVPNLGTDTRIPREPDCLANLALHTLVFSVTKSLEIKMGDLATNRRFLRPVGKPLLESLLLGYGQVGKLILLGTYAFPVCSQPIRYY